jgi:flagellar hook-basal body complex protein FliE
MAIPPLPPIGLGPTLDQLCPTTPPSLSPPSLSEPPAEEAPFARALEHFLARVTGQHAAAEQAVLDLATGKTEDIHQVMLAVAKADLTFRMVLQVRNRLTEAYQAITQMQV